MNNVILDSELFDKLTICLWHGGPVFPKVVGLNPTRRETMEIDKNAKRNFKKGIKTNVPRR